MRPIAEESPLPRRERGLDPAGKLPCSLPSRSYYDPAEHRREMSAIFEHAWLYAGTRCPPQAGRLLVEVCGREVAIERRENGALRGRDRERDAAVAVEGFCELLFVNLDAEAAPLREAVEEAEAEIRATAPRLDALHLAHRRHYELRANWKNVVDNYSECYHCPVAHRGFIDGHSQVATYSITTHPGYHRHSSAAKQGDDPGAAAGPTPKALGGWYLWPSTALEVYPTGIVSVLAVVPRAPEHSTLIIEWHCARERPTPAELAVIDYLHDTVRSEDLAIVESVQRGLRSRSFERGPLMVDAERSFMSEHALQDFQAKVLRACERVR